MSPEKHSLRFFEILTTITLTLCLSVAATVLACSGIKMQKPSPNKNGESRLLISQAQATTTQAGGKKTTNQTEATPAPTVTGVLTIHHQPGVKGCPNMGPVCAGGLMSQRATAGMIMAYRAKWSTVGCRFMQPPRCYSGEIRSCREECTP